MRLALMYMKQIDNANYVILDPIYSPCVQILWPAMTQAILWWAIMTS
jgi:hypothetical protein